jgi:hypothetical protein
MIPIFENLITNVEYNNGEENAIDFLSNIETPKILATLPSTANMAFLTKVL